MRQSLVRAFGVALVAMTVVTAGLVGWTLWQQRGGAAGPVSGSEVTPSQGTVAEVMAANRLRLASGGEVRLAAIEVPAPGQPFAEEGRQATLALTRNRPVQVDGPPEAAFVFLPDGQLLQELLLSGGYARVSEGAPTDAMGERLRAAERQARDGNLGLWGGAPIAALPTALPTPQAVACEPSLVPGNTFGPAEAAAHLGEEANIVFLPLRADERNGSVTLLTGLTSNDFGVVIPANLALGEADVGTRYLNRCLVATGRLETGVEGGPRLVLRSWDQLIVVR